MTPSRLAGLMAACFLVFAPPTARGEEPLVSLASVERMTVAAGKTFIGTVIPTRTSTVGSPVAGRVLAMPIDDGQRVRREQVLARLDTRLLDIDLEIARAELDAFEQDLAELLNGARPEELARAQARLKSRKAIYEITKRQFEREIALRQAGSNSELAIEDAQLALSEAEGAYLEAKSDAELLEVGSRPERVAAARARVRAQQESIRRIEEEIEEHVITAPFDGYVVERHGEVGQWFQLGAPVATIAALDPVEIETYVLEDYVTHLGPGSSTRVEVTALEGRSWTGEVAAIVPQANVRTRSFPVRVRVQNDIHDEGPLLKSGMFARVTLPVGKPVDALLVPKDALVLANARTMVFLAQGDVAVDGLATVQGIDVELGVAHGDHIQVLGDVESGDLVVTYGNERLIDGQAVRIAPADDRRSLDGGTSAAAATRKGGAGSTTARLNP